MNEYLDYELSAIHARDALERLTRERDALRDALETLTREISYLIEDGTLDTFALEHAAMIQARRALALGEGE